jgi:hypothetical protein
MRQTASAPIAQLGAIGEMAMASLLVSPRFALRFREDLPAIAREMAFPTRNKSARR